jgi:hypothetical protein
MEEGTSIRSASAQRSSAGLMLRGRSDRLVIIQAAKMKAFSAASRTTTVLNFKPNVRIWPPRQHACTARLPADFRLAVDSSGARLAALPISALAGRSLGWPPGESHLEASWHRAAFAWSIPTPKKVAAEAK